MSSSWPHTPDELTEFIVVLILIGLAVLVVGGINTLLLGAIR